jgi:hypothetical protein
MSTIIGLTGYAQSGKDTVAKTLIEKFGFTRLAFADSIRDFLYEVDPIVGYVANEPVFLSKVVDRDGWDEAKKNPEVRRLLQRIGVAARNQWSKDFWVSQVLKKMYPAGPNKKYVITDVRFPNEAEALRVLKGQIWRVTRPGISAVNSHVSESALDNYKFDQVFVNDAGLKDLEDMITIRMRGYDLG